MDLDPSAGPLIEASELYRFYHAGDEETFALRGISLTVRAGEFVSILGPSGSGKSTLLACLAGLDEPDGGHVMIAGQRITRRPEATRAAIRGRWIGILLQSGNLLEPLSLIENIRAARALTPKSRGRDSRELLEELGLADRASARPSTLSGGESARAGLAVALANDPPVLLADEPTGEVDAAAEGRIVELLRERAESGRAVIVVTHSERVAGATDRVVRMLDGKVANG